MLLRRGRKIWCGNQVWRKCLVIQINAGVGMKVAVTGHRDERLGDKKDRVRYWLIGQFKNLLACYDKISLIDGVARGVDQIAALIAISLGIDIYCYFPYRRKLNKAE